MRHDTMIHSVHFKFDPKDADTADSLLRELRDASRKEPGVMQFEVGRSCETPNIFALWEVYHDQAAIDMHVASEHFQRLVVNGVRPLSQELKIERVVPI